MPQILDIADPQSASLAEATEAIAALDFDPTCEERTAEAARWLRRLSNNCTFLADLLVDQLAGREGGALASVDSGYGPQAIVLSPHIQGRSGGMFLRANIWPAEQDLCFQTSSARSFVYGVPHDHNFGFLTVGYCGPGYRSDYYEYDYERVSGYAGEPVDLRFVERSALHEGKLMLYRAHRDIHSQLPPEALSVSLNVMHVDPAQNWFDQYGFDLERREVSRVLSPNSTEVFLRVAVASGAPEALDFAEWAGRSHPSERLRLASFEARAGQLDAAESDELWRKAELCGSRMVAEIASVQRYECSGT
ncbi:MAG: transposase [Pseudomonadota bacterium]